LLLLAFESSATSAGAALAEDGVLLGEYHQNCGRTHSVTLMKMASDLLENCGRTVLELDATAVAVGPGSFTGLRIGIAAAKGLSWGREIPCVGVSTLEAMALSCAVTDGVYVCCMDARRQQVYNAVFSCEGGVLTRMTPDRAISAAELEEELKKTEKTKILVGDGAMLCYNTFRDKNALLLPPAHQRLQRASGVALAAFSQLAAGETEPAAAVLPNYLRLSQAERERAERILQKGEV